MKPKNNKTTKKNIEINTSPKNLNSINCDFESEAQSGSSSTNKRFRDILQNSIVESVAKAPRLTDIQSPFKTITTIEKRFDKLSDELTNKLESLMENILRDREDRLLNVIEARINKTMEKFEKTVQDLKIEVNDVKERMCELESVAADVFGLKKEIQELKKEIDKHENASVACDVRINGVPMYENDNVNEIFNNLCATVNIDRPVVKSIFRLKKTKSGINNTDPAIIVRFGTPFDKNNILKSISSLLRMRKGPLTLNDIGIDSDTPFNVKENLTPKNFRIYIEAIKLWKDNKLSSVFSMRGIVYAKVNRSDTPIRIDSIDNIYSLFRSQSNHNYNVSTE